MADLPTIADRLNDIEISASAPVTETLWRRFGSNINFILDFLGVSDGDTTASGDLSDFAQALSTIRSHTLALQFTNPSTGTHTIGSFAQIPFVDFVFLAEDLDVPISPGVLSGSRIVPQVSYDSGVTFKHINASKVDPSSTTLVATTSAGKIDGTNSSYGGPTTTPSAAPFDQFFDAAVGAMGFEHRMRLEAWRQFATISWRDMPAGAGTTVLKYTTTGPGAVKFYLKYQLNVESMFLVAP